MDRPDVAMFVVGAVGVLVAFVIVQPGEYILELGTLRFDPSLAVIGIRLPRGLGNCDEPPTFDRVPSSCRTHEI